MSEYVCVALVRYGVHGTVVLALDYGVGQGLGSLWTVLGGKCHGEGMELTKSRAVLLFFFFPLCPEVFQEGEEEH